MITCQKSADDELFFLVYRKKQRITSDNFFSEIEIN